MSSTPKSQQHLHKDALEGARSLHGSQTTLTGADVASLVAGTGDYSFISWDEPFGQIPKGPSSSGLIAPPSSPTGDASIFTDPSYGDRSNRSRASSDASFIEPWVDPPRSPTSPGSTMAYTWTPSDDNFTLHSSEHIVPHAPTDRISTPTTVQPHRPTKGITDVISPIAHRERAREGPESHSGPNLASEKESQQLASSPMASDVVEGKMAESCTKPDILYSLAALGIGTGTDANDSERHPSIGTSDLGSHSSIMTPRPDESHSVRGSGEDLASQSEDASDWDRWSEGSSPDSVSSVVPPALSPLVRNAAIALFATFLRYRGSGSYHTRGNQRDNGSTNEPSHSQSSNTSTNIFNPQLSNQASSTSNALPRKRPSDDEDDHRPPQRRRLDASPEHIKCRFLACPFAKKSPLRHRKCFKYVIQEIARLK